MGLDTRSSDLSRLLHMNVEAPLKPAGEIRTNSYWPDYDQPMLGGDSEGISETRGVIGGREISVMTDKTMEIHLSSSQNEMNWSKNRGDRW